MIKYDVHHSADLTDAVHAYARLTALFQDYPGEPVPER